MRQAWEITRKDLQVAFGDRNLLLIMFAAPLVLVSIIGLTFGGITSGTPIKNIPVAIVNLDTGTAIWEEDAENSLNYGGMISSLFVTGTVGTPFTSLGEGMDIGGVSTGEFSCPTAVSTAMDAPMTNLDDIVDGVVFTSVEAARAAVDAGDVSAAVIIPAEFSRNLAVSPVDTQIRPSTIEIYVSPATPIAGEIVTSIVYQITTQFTAGNVTLAALIASLPANPLQIASIITSPAFSEGVACAFSDAGAGVNIRNETSSDGRNNGNFIVMIGAAQAMFFALFVANGMAGTIISERRNWTLQRMLMTPTPSVMVLFGKMMGVFVLIFLQLIVLFIGLALLNPILSGSMTPVWGTNYPAIFVSLAAAAFATAGIGSITASLAQNEEQASTIGSVVAIFMALFGGAFGFNLSSSLNSLSVIYWGQTAFTKLASGNNDILINIAALVVFGVVSLALSFFLFRRKITDR